MCSYIYSNLNDGNVIQMEKKIILLSILAVLLITGCIGSKQDAFIGIVNTADSGQITYVDVTISHNGIVSEMYSVHENLQSLRHPVHIGDQATFEARGGHFVGFCEDRTCTRTLTTQRTYQITITEYDKDIYAVFEHS